MLILCLILIDASLKLREDYCVLYIKHKVCAL